MAEIETIKVKHPTDEYTVINAGDFDPSIHERYDEKQPLRADGPTLEEFVDRGYRAIHYPPEGYAERTSPGLTEFREREKAAVALITGKQNDAVVRISADKSPLEIVKLALELEGDQDKPRKAVVDALAARVTELSTSNQQV